MHCAFNSDSSEHKLLSSPALLASRMHGGQKPPLLNPTKAMHANFAETTVWGQRQCCAVELKDPLIRAATATSLHSAASNAADTCFSLCGQYHT
jgi:hypothetical protein